MKKRNIILALLAVLTFTAQTTVGQSLKCHIEGTILTDKYGDDVVICENGTELAVSDRKELHVKAINGHFSTDIETDGIRMYEAFLFEEFRQGNWYPMKFLVENGANIQITLTGNEKGAVHSDGHEMQKYQRLEQLQDSLFNRKINAIYDELESNKEEYYVADYLSAMQIEENMDEDTPQQYSDSIYNIIDYYNKHEEEQFTDKGRVLYQKQLSMNDSLRKFNFRYYGEHPMIWMLFEMPECFHMAKVEENAPRFYRHYWSEKLVLYRQLYDNLYCHLYTDHPIHQQITIAAKAYDLRPGQKYIDYMVRNTDGQLVPISTLTAGKVVLINLWASWCGSCRGHSKAMIPVYEKYKDQGFTVVAIAREQKREAMENAAKHDGYPWPSLLELNDENHIWEKNGAQSGGGAEFLIDRDGTILSTSTDAEELEQQIKKALHIE